MIQIPENVIKQVKFFCETNRLGFSQVGMGDKFTVLVIGRADLGINTTHVMAAHAILDVVVRGVTTASNEEIANENNEDSLQH